MRQSCVLDYRAQQAFLSGPMDFRPLIAAPLLLWLVLAPAPLAAQTAQNPLAQDYEPAPALWKLSDEDTTIYLFGTFHVLPEGLRWRTAQFDRIAARVDSLVLESSDEDAEATVEEFAPKLQSVNANRLPTSERLAPELRRRWQEMIESTGQDFAIVDSMPLALVMLGLGGDGPAGRLSRRDLGVESVLTAEFTASGRPIGSIENNGAVMLSLMRMDDRPMLADLSAELARMEDRPLKDEQGAVQQAQDWSLEHAWARGVVDPDFNLGMGNGKVGTAFQRVLLARRNEAWSHWLQARLEQPGTILVAVGAGHFEGRRSLRHFLEQRGLHLERIN